MPQKSKHGVFSPTNTFNSKVVSASSRKNKTNRKIRLDRLIRSKNPKILIKRRLGGIGDVLMSTPLLKNIKKVIPNAHITYATDLEYSWGALGEVIKHNPYVDSLISCKEVKGHEYDYSVDITTTGLSVEKPGTVPPNRIDLFADEVGISIDTDPTPDWIVREEEREVAREFIDSFLEDKKDREKYKFIMIQCRSNDSRRTWPMDYVDQLADILAQNKNSIIFLMDWGCSVDRWKERDRVCPIKGQPIVETAALMEQCDLVICPDSSLLHLAGALNKKTVAIFGPIPAASRINYYANCTAVQLDLPCKNCWYVQRCGKGTGGRLECLTGISPEMVAEAARKKIMEPNKTLNAVKYGKDLTKKNQDQAILVKRMYGGLGDILMTGPAIKALKTKFPNKKIHYAIPQRYHELMQNLNFIDKILDVDRPINFKIYEQIMDISSPDAFYESSRVYSGKKVQKSRVEIYAEALGVRHLLSTHIPIYNVTDDEKKWASIFLESKKLDKDKKLLAIQLKSAEEYRDYPKEKLPKLFNLLKNYYNIILLGEESKTKYNDVIDARGYGIRKFAAIMDKCDGLISVDTGPLHLGAALNMKIVAIFGPIDYKVRCKEYKNTTVMTSNLPCIPCWRNGTTKCKQTGQVKGTSKCMNSIPPKSIVELVRKKI